MDAEHLYTSTDAVKALRVKDGKQAWSYQGTGVTAYGPPAVKDGVVYAVEAVGERGLVAIDAGTGELLWREKNPVASGHELRVAPTVDDNYVYKHCAAGLRAIGLRSHETAWLHPEVLDKFSALIAEGLLIGIGEGPVAALPLERSSDQASS